MDRLFQLGAILLMAVFYACYFRKMWLQKKQGIRTDQLGRGKTGVVRAVEVSLKAASFAVPSVELISIALNASGLPQWARLLGLLAGLAGDAVFIIAVVTMADNWRAGVSPDEKTELVRSGIYGFSRNPAFLGFDLLYLGILLLFFNWPLFLVSAAAAALFHLQIVNVEEDFLLEAFGEDYLQYRREVRRYLGRKRGKQD